jgi:hypothetical protein
MATPILIAVTILPSGDHDTVWSLRPGLRVHYTVPAGQFTDTTIQLIQNTILPKRFPKELGDGPG